jgi:predicted exporter
LSASARLGLAALWLALALGVVALRWEVANELPSLVESREHAQLAELSRRMTDGAAARTLTLVLTADSERAALAAARELAGELRARSDLERVSAGPPAGTLAALEALYFPRRFAFADAAGERLARADEPALRARARALRGALAGPEAGWLAQHAARDPLLLFRTQLAKLEAAQRGALETRDGQWATADGAAVLFARTRATPFDADAQAPLLAALDAAGARFAERGVRVETSGLHRFALNAQLAAQRDAQRISLISFALIAALFVLLFGSLRALAAGALQLALALASATAACLLAFGSLHVLTLAFGATLIGACIDYPIHLAHHHSLAGDARGPLGSLRAIAPALVVGAATSIAGFAGLGLSDFPGLHELGLFGSVGLIAGLAALWVVAPIFPRTLPPTRAQARLAEALARGYARMRARPRACRAALALCAAGIALAAARTTFSDDVFALSLPPSAELVAEEARVQARLGASERARFAAVFGTDDAEALARLEALTPRLERAAAQGALASFDSLAPLLRSAAAQAASERAFRTAPALAERIERAFAAEGFAPGAFAPFAADLAAAAPPPLAASDLAGTPLADAVAALRVPLASGVAYVVTLRGIADFAAVGRAVSGVSGAALMDQRRFAAELYAHYRAEVAPLLAAGIGLVALVLGARFRSLRLVAAAGLPALLAAGAVLATLALRGEPVTLLHLFGLVLVLCFAEDYGVFLVEARADAALAAALTSIVAAALTTALSFGLLAFSAFPALAALGFTAGLGSLAALITSPLAAAALLPQARSTPD